MQTDADDAPNFQEKPQNGYTRAKSIKKIKSNFKYIFQVNSTKKGKKNTIQLDTKQVKSTITRKLEVATFWITFQSNLCSKNVLYIIYYLFIS